MESIPLTRWTKFLLNCSGTTLRGAFNRTSIDDQQKRKKTGAVVFTIVFASACLAGLSWTIPFGAYGIFVAPFWFFIMLSLERLILQQMDTNASHEIAKQWMNENFGLSNSKSWSWSKFRLVTIRFILIFFISYVNSEMIQVLMFRNEIVSEIMLRQDNETARINDSLSIIRKTVEDKFGAKEKALNTAQGNLADLISNYDTKISAIDDSIQKWTSQHVYEVSGEGGITHKRGDGSVAKTMEKTLNKLTVAKIDLVAEREDAKSNSAQVTLINMAQKELDQAKAEKKTELDKLDKIKEDLVRQLKARPVNGLYFMLTVLSDISGRNPFVWFMFCLLFLIEAIPVIVKSMMKNDSFVFESALEYLEMRAETDERAKRAVAKLMSLSRKMN